MALTLSQKCDTTAITLDVETEPLAYGALTTEHQVFGMIEPLRIGHVPTPFMLHIITDNPDVDCPEVKIERVVECPNGCAFDEFKYPMPCECSPHRLLPSGTYDVLICRQEAYPMEEGDSLNVTFMVEPVSGEFAAIYAGKL